jgi:hypothetical protein
MDFRICFSKFPRSSHLRLLVNMEEGDLQEHGGEEEPGGDIEAEFDGAGAAGAGGEAVDKRKKKNRNNRRKGKPAAVELVEMDDAVTKRPAPLSCWQPALPPLCALATGGRVPRLPARGWGVLLERGCAEGCGSGSGWSGARTERRWCRGEG